MEILFIEQFARYFSLQNEMPLPLRFFESTCRELQEALAGFHPFLIDVMAMISLFYLVTHSYPIGGLSHSIRVDHCVNHYADVG